MKLSTPPPWLNLPTDPASWTQAWVTLERARQTIVRMDKWKDSKDPAAAWAVLDFLLSNPAAVTPYLHDAFPYLRHMQQGVVADRSESAARST